MKESALGINQLMVNYGHTRVLWDVSINIPSGLLVGIIGPNGAGKSTLIKAALGLIKPLSGKINFFGSPLKKCRKLISYVPQREAVDWDFPITVRELTMMGCYGKLGLFRNPTKADYLLVDEYLDKVGMLDYAERQISQLSGGQQQRVFLARALVQEAEVYFLDEPFSGVDHATEAILIQMLKELKNKGKTVFVVHHDLNTVESYYDWLILLNMHLIAYGKTEDVFTPENLNATYGKNYSLFDEAFKLSRQRKLGE